MSTTSVPSAPRLDLGRLEWPQPRLLDVDGQADAAPEPRPRVQSLLLGAYRLVVEALQQLGEERGEIAGVVDGAHAERLRPAVVGHLVGADQVAPADLGGIEAEPGGTAVQQPLADEVALGAAGRAQRAGRRLVGDDGPEIAGVARHAIGAGQQGGAELGGHQRRRPHVGTDVGADDGADGEDAAVAVEADLDLVGDLAGVVGGHEVLAPALDPLHRPPQLERGQRHQDVLRVQLTAHAEAAADVDLGEPQRARREAEDRRQDRAVDVDALGGADQVQLAPARVGRHGHEPARLQRGGRLPRVVEALADDHGGAGQRGVGVAHPHGDGGDVVGVGAVEQPGRAGGEGGGHRGAGRPRLVDGVDQLGGVAGDVRIVGDDEGDRLAHVADDGAGDGRLQVAVGAGRRRHPVGDDGGGRHVGGGQDRAHARQVARALGVERDQASVGVGRAEHGGVQHARHAHVVHEPAGAGHERAAAQPRMRLTDHREIPSQCRVSCAATSAGRSSGHQ